MRVLVKPDHRAPVVVSMVWYKVGSMDEVTGTTGVAHVLEHMMFKGTKAVPGGEFSRIIAEAGGRDNAFTSRDYTGYHQTLHKSQLGARDEARSRPHDEPRAVARGVREGDPRGDGRAPLAHRRPAARARLRAVERRGASRRIPTAIRRSAG